MNKLQLWVEEQCKAMEEAFWFGLWSALMLVALLVILIIYGARKVLELVNTLSQLWRGSDA